MRIWKVLTAVGLCLVAVVVVYLYATWSGHSVLTPQIVQVSLPGGAVDTLTLGGAIYAGASNPIQNKLPDVAPVTNPVQGLYKNPFE